MTAKKNDSIAIDDRPATAGAARFVRAHARWAIVAAIIVGAGAFGWTKLWDEVREHVVASSEYRLDATAIEITPLPAWIHADIKAEVIRDASLDKSLSVLDPELTIRVAQAFRLHPWVGKVDRVTKRYPAGVQVDLIYRRPVAMVEVPGPALLPVDIEGTLLPTEDFTPVDARHYPRIGEIKTSPLGPVGTRWGDTHVTGAALVAAAVGEQWESLKLNHIVPAGRQTTPGGAETDAYEIYTKAGTLIDWGRPPGAEISGEASATTKVARLLEYASKHDGSLDDDAKPKKLDVHPINGLIATPRAAIRTLSQQTSGTGD